MYAKEKSAKKSYNLAIFYTFLIVTVSLLILYSFKNSSFVSVIIEF